MRMFQNSPFWPEIRFFQYIFTNIFFQYCPNLGGSKNPPLVQRALDNEFCFLSMQSDKKRCLLVGGFGESICQQLIELNQVSFVW